MQGNIGSPSLERLGCAIGKGLIAGFAGTVAISAAQVVEMRMTKRKSSNTPVDAAGKVLGVAPTSDENAAKFNNMVHWFYGTVWGLPRGFLELTGLRGVIAGTIHFLGIWIGGMILLPALKVSSPPWKWGAKSIVMDGLLHIVYAVGAGIVYGLIGRHTGDID